MALAGPDRVVEKRGVDAELEVVTDYELDDGGQVDPDSIERVSTTINVVPSHPSEEDEQRTEGRLSTGSLRLTVASDVDVSADRDGRRDRIYMPPRNGYGSAYGENYGGEATARRFEVVEVIDDRHPLTGTQKKTVLVDRLEGH